MKLKINIIIGLLMFTGLCAYGQMEQYDYKRELHGITDQWHKVILPDEIFGNLSPNLSDLRIYGVTASNDTIEAPYLLRLGTEKRATHEVNFKNVNTSYDKKRYYFTFEIPTKEPVNNIKLNFNQQNFDWRVKLEGSHTQQEWFTVLDDYRILSIKNQLTDFTFTNITFPDTKFRFLRMGISALEKPQLTTATLALKEVSHGSYRTFTVKRSKTTNEQQTKQTVIHIDLTSPVPVSRLSMSIKDKVDFYRPVVIQYLIDSIKTDKGYLYNYQTLTSGTLNSLENNDFMCNSTIMQRLKIIIQNQDNQALTIDKITINGCVHELLVRFTEPASYFLTYGNKNVSDPNYDIDRFAEKIPSEVLPLELGVEQPIIHKKVSGTQALFMNKNWLWAIMIIIILLLGWFSVKMINKK